MLTGSDRACAVCGGGAASLFAHKNEWRFVRCDGCGFVYLDPMPTQETLNELYADDRAISEAFYPKARGRHQRGLLRALRLLPHVWHRRAIDVGCGGGFVTDGLRRCGAIATGVDVSAAAIAYARRNYPHCTFHCASFNEFRPPHTYDFVYTSELIEHVAKLDEFMNLMVALTHAGSRVYVTTPDLGSERRPADVVAWDVFAPPYHVQFFDQQTLSRLFSAHGFRALQRYPDRKSGLRMLFERL